MRNAQEACKIDVSESAARLHGRAVSVLCETGSQAAEAGREIADQAEAELVQVIGKRVVLYRETTRDDIEKIQLVK